MNAADHYLADRVLTATPAQLTGMLFEAASASLRGAVRLQEAGDFPAALPRSLKAQRILMELRSALDHSVDPAMADGLDVLYAWAHSSLLRANRDRDAAGTRDALAVVDELGLAWRQGVLGAADVPA